MSLNVITIISKSYLPWARALSQQLSSTNKDASLTVFLADKPDGLFEPSKENFHMIALSEFFPISKLQAMTGYYSAYEFCNALKPYAHLYSAQILKFESWVYLDSDTIILNDLTELVQQSKKQSILLCPHLLKAAPGTQYLESIEVGILRAGVYNGGCLALSNTQTTQDFLIWWRDRLIFNCLANEPGLEADQSWLNFVPVFFSDTHISRDPTLNIAYWNLAERPLTLRDGKVYTKGLPVKFMHLSGWDWRNPIVPNKHINVELGSSKEAWDAVVKKLHTQLISCGIETCSSWPYSFGQFPQKARRLYLEECKKHPDSSNVEEALNFYVSKLTNESKLSWKQRAKEIAILLGFRRLKRILKNNL